MEATALQPPSIGQLDDVLGVEVERVLGERGARGVLDALVDGQDRDIAGSGQAAVLKSVWRLRRTRGLRSLGDRPGRRSRDRGGGAGRCSPSGSGAAAGPARPRRGSLLVAQGGCRRRCHGVLRERSPREFSPIRARRWLANRSTRSERREGSPIHPPALMYRSRDGPAPHHRRWPPRRGGRDLRQQERGPSGHGRGPAHRPAPGAEQRPGHRGHPDHGGDARPSRGRGRDGSRRSLAAPRRAGPGRRGGRRPHPPDAGLLPAPGGAGGADRGGGDRQARRRRHRDAPGGAAPGGAASDGGGGRRNRDQLRGPGQAAPRRPHLPGHADRHRDREPDDGRRPRRWDHGDQQRRPRASRLRPRPLPGGDGSPDQRRRQRADRRRGPEHPAPWHPPPGDHRLHRGRDLHDRGGGDRRRRRDPEDATHRPPVARATSCRPPGARSSREATTSA